MEIIGKAKGILTIRSNVSVMMVRDLYFSKGRKLKWHVSLIMGRL